MREDYEFRNGGLFRINTNIWPSSDVISNYKVFQSHKLPNIGFTCIFLGGKYFIIFNLNSKLGFSSISLFDVPINMLTALTNQSYKDAVEICSKIINMCFKKSIYLNSHDKHLRDLIGLILILVLIYF